MQYQVTNESFHYFHVLFMTVYSKHLWCPTSKQSQNWIEHNPAVCERKAESNTQDPKVMGRISVVALMPHLEVFHLLNFATLQRNQLNLPSALK